MYRNDKNRKKQLSVTKKSSTFYNQCLSLSGLVALFNLQCALLELHWLF